MNVDQLMPNSNYKEFSHHGLRFFNIRKMNAPGSNDFFLFDVSYLSFKENRTVLFENQKAYCTTVEELKSVLNSDFKTLVNRFETGFKFEFQKSEVSINQAKEVLLNHFIGRFKEIVSANQKEFEELKIFQKRMADGDKLINSKWVEEKTKGYHPITIADLQGSYKTFMDIRGFIAIMHDQGFNLTKYNAAKILDQLVKQDFLYLNRIEGHNNVLWYRLSSEEVRKLYPDMKEDFTQVSFGIS